MAIATHKLHCWTGVCQIRTDYLAYFHWVEFVATIKNKYKQRSHFGIGIIHGTNASNVGTLWRSAYVLGASYIFTVHRKYKRVTSDVSQAWSKIPLFHYSCFEDLKDHIPYNAKLVGIEMVENAVSLPSYVHPQHAVYLLGNEQSGLGPNVLNLCHDVIQIPGNYSLNVAVAGSVIMYDRVAKIPSFLPDEKFLSSP